MFSKFVKKKYHNNKSSDGVIEMSTWQAAKGKASDIVLHFQPSLCPIESRLHSNLEWEPCMMCDRTPNVQDPTKLILTVCTLMLVTDEERCIAFIAGSRASEELHHLADGHQRRHPDAHY